MDDRLVILLSADDGLNAPRRQSAIRVQLLARNGVVPCDADALGNIEIQDKIVVKIEVVYLDVEQSPAGLNFPQHGTGVKLLSVSSEL